MGWVVDYIQAEVMIVFLKLSSVIKVSPLYHFILAEIGSRSRLLSAGRNPFLKIMVAKNACYFF